MVQGTEHLYIVRDDCILLRNQVSLERRNRNFLDLSRQQPCTEVFDSSQFN
jgi:hypothetical protein